MIRPYFQRNQGPPPVIPDEVDETVAAIVKAQTYADAQKYARLLRHEADHKERCLQERVSIYVDGARRVAELLEKVKP